MTQGPFEITLTFSIWLQNIHKTHGQTQKLSDRLLTVAIYTVQMKMEVAVPAIQKIETKSKLLRGFPIDHKTQLIFFHTVSWDFLLDYSWNKNLLYKLN